MWVYIARRLIWLPVLLLAVSLVTFALGRFGPGDPVQVILGARYEEETADRLREQLGLNRPFFVQYGDYVWKAMRGDLGESIRFPGPRGERAAGREDMGVVPGEHRGADCERGAGPCRSDSGSRTSRGDGRTLPR